MKEVSQELQQGEWRDKKILDFECWIGTDVEFWMVNDELNSEFVGFREPTRTGAFRWG